MTRRNNIGNLTESGLRDQKALASTVSAPALRNRSTGDRTAVPLRRSFIIHPNHAKPPLAKIVGGDAGQGGGTSLKLLLSLLWHAKKDDPTVTRPAIYWAQLIGLVDPDREMATDSSLDRLAAEHVARKKGKDRINAALRTLEDKKFLTRETRKGKLSIIHLNEETLRTHDDDSPIAYSSPGKVLKERLVPADERHWHHYLTIPSHLWTSGAIARLDGAGLATLLIFLNSLPYEKNGPDPGIYWTTKDWKDHFWLSPDIRYRGLKQDEKLELIKHRSYPLNIRFAQDAPDGRYYEYYLLDDKLDDR